MTLMNLTAITDVAVTELTGRRDGHPDGQTDTGSERERDCGGRGDRRGRTYRQRACKTSGTCAFGCNVMKLVDVVYYLPYLHHNHRRCQHQLAEFMYVNPANTS